MFDRLEKLFLTIERQFGFIGLNAPASPEQVGAVERVLDLSLPAELRAFYLRFNGQPATGWSFFPPFFKFPTLEELLYEWKSDLDAYSEDRRREALEIVDDVSQLVVIPFHGTPKRILVGKCDMSVYLYCDLDPGPAGTLGQIIHQDVQCEPRVFAWSFIEAVDMVIKASEAGTIKFDPEEQGWVRRDGGALVGDIHVELAC